MVRKLPGWVVMDELMRAAIDEAKQGLAEGGIPIGSVLLYKIPKVVV